MDRWHNKVAVVTGASSGIGAAIVKDLLRAGVKVVALARRIERVEDIRNLFPTDKQEQFWPLKCDICNQHSVNVVFDQIIAHWGAVDILVNNAGCQKAGQIVTMPAKEMAEVLQTNVVGGIYCTQRAFKSMHERNFNGHIILINSISGHKVLHCDEVPQRNIYASSKYAITAMTEVLRQEFRGMGTQIKITSISPGATDTEILPDHARSYVGDCLLRPEDISSAVLFALSTPPRVQIHEMIIKPVGEMF